MTVSTNNMSANNPEPIDVNSPQIYDKFQEQIDLHMARLKNNLFIVKQLRLDAAEIEVETAALYHAEHWHDIEELKTIVKTTAGDADMANEP